MPESRESLNGIVEKVSTVSSAASSVTQFTFDSLSSQNVTGFTGIGTRIAAPLVLQYSIQSFGGQSDTEAPTPTNLDELNDDGVIKLVNDLETKIKRLKVENMVFLRFLESNDPESITDMDETLNPKKPYMETRYAPAFGRQRSTFSKTFIKKSSIFSLRQTSTLSSINRREITTKINVDQKSDLVTKEMEEHQFQIEKDKQKLRKTKRRLLAELEERETRKAELDESFEKFEQFKQSSEQITLEKIERFLNEWSKKSRYLSEKIRLRFSSLKVHLQKISPVLAHKQKIGENLSAIDFENLRVENFHLAEYIDKKTKLLIELKLMTARGGLKLSKHKALLEQKVDRKDLITEAIKKLEDDIAKSDNQLEKLFSEVDEVKGKFDKVKSNLQQYDPPDVMDYIKKKAEGNHLEKEIKAWSRHKIFKEMAVDVEINKMRKLFQCKKTHPSWFE